VTANEEEEGDRGDEIGMEEARMGEVEMEALWRLTALLTR